MQCMWKNYCYERRTIPLKFLRWHKFKRIRVRRESSGAICPKHMYDVTDPMQKFRRKMPWVNTYASIRLYEWIRDCSLNWKWFISGWVLIFQRNEAFQLQQQQQGRSHTISDIHSSQTNSADSVRESRKNALYSTWRYSGLSIQNNDDKMTGRVE